MDTLTNYITERIRIDNIKYPEFPVDGTLDDIIQFLKENGFVKLTLEGNVFKSFINAKARSFDINLVTDRIWFADTSKNKISEDNPVFLICRSGSTNVPYYDDESFDEPRKKSDFLEMLNKRFGF